jgi:predicted DNA-binding transcriptional regulator YafY
MRPTELLQEIRKIRFEESFSIWTEGRITQEEAARMLGVCSRTLRRYIDRYHNDGLDGHPELCLQNHNPPRGLPVVLTKGSNFYHESLDLCA